MLPIIFVSSFLFWWFFWKLNQIPSESFHIRLLMRVFREK